MTELEALPPTGRFSIMHGQPYFYATDYNKPCEAFAIDVTCLRTMIGYIVDDCRYHAIAYWFNRWLEEPDQYAWDRIQFWIKWRLEQK